MTEYNPLDGDTDPFRPPAQSTVVGCIHCGEVYDSYRIEWRVETGFDGRPHGFWCCPIENCDGRGFGFDILPIDEDYRDENGDKVWIDDEEESDDGPDDESDSSANGNHGSTGANPKDDELPW